jgi:hypothetical protein
MNPAAFFNLYKGALGEEGVKAVLEHAGCIIESVPSAAYEECDFIVRLSSHSEPVAVDAKHWRYAGDAKRYESKLESLHSALGVKRFAYINLFGDGEAHCRRLDSEFIPTSELMAPILEVSGLVHRAPGTTLVNHINYFLLWMKETA